MGPNPGITRRLASATSKTRFKMRLRIIPLVVALCASNPLFSQSDLNQDPLALVISPAFSPPPDLYENPPSLYIDSALGPSLYHKVCEVPDGPFGMKSGKTIPPLILRQASEDGMAVEISPDRATANFVWYLGSYPCNGWILYSQEFGKIVATGNAP